ncbi:LytR C-terminal domain-containing protein, partial [Streptomyces sp. SID10244]|nr:LytR C-terminal domain-containing protein [Streptomyces sp. SID10244]
GTTTDGLNNEIPRTEAINAIFNSIIDDDPLPGEKAKKKAASSTSKSPSSSAAAPSSEAAPTKLSATAQSPGNVGVRVLNGTDRSGVASEVSDQLVSEGFDVRGVADASENRDETVIRYGAGE